MTALLGSELLKLRTVRSFWGYVLAVVAFAGLGAAGTIGGATEQAREQASFAVDLATVVGIAGLVGLVLGIVLVTNEFRHGTITPTFLVTPRRERVLVAKLVTGGISAVGLALLALTAVVVVSIVWLAVIGVSPPLHSDVTETVGRAVLQTMLTTLLAVAIGSVVHAQVAALIGTLLWFLAIETLVAALLGVVDLDGVAPYLPNGASSAILEPQGDDPLSLAAAVAVSLAWVAVVFALGLLRTRRADIT